MSSVSYEALVYAWHVCRRYPRIACEMNVITNEGKYKASEAKLGMDELLVGEMGKDCTYEPEAVKTERGIKYIQYCKNEHMEGYRVRQVNSPVLRREYCTSCTRRRTDGAVTLTQHNGMRRKKRQGKGEMREWLLIEDR